MVHVVMCKSAIHICRGSRHLSAFCRLLLLRDCQWRQNMGVSMGFTIPDVMPKDLSTVEKVLDDNANRPVYH
jgi:hypothetical protein